MNTGEQFDIFSTESVLDTLFERLPSDLGSKEHAVAVTRHVKSECLPVMILERVADKTFPYHVVVSDSDYTLNAFNCLQGAQQFIARHQLHLA